MIKRLLCLVLFVGSLPAAARVGFGDPADAWREKQPEDWMRLEGHLRLRIGAFSNLDLDRGVSPSSQTALWPAGTTPLDITSGQDMRLRLRPSFFWGDNVRVVLGVDVLDNVALGASPKGAPYRDKTAIVAGTAFQEPLTFALGAFRVRDAYAEARLPFGVLFAGRMPSHFGLGIAANNGNDLDDDGGDRADRIGFMAPLFGHYVAVGLDWAASGPRVADAGIAPDPGRVTDGVHAASVAVVRYHAPWEVKLYRDAWRPRFDYGAVVSVQGQWEDTPGFYRTLDSTLGVDDFAVVDRRYGAAVLDVWARLWWGDIKLEAEAVGSHFVIANPSPYAGVVLREPVTGNPFGAVANAEYRTLRDRLSVFGEVGLASADPGFGFPVNGPSAFAAGRPGDVYGSQLDGTHDTRMDAFRFHPAYRVDLIMWRTLLGGVSEAAFGRAKIGGQPLPGLGLEANAIYSHGLSAASTPGGRAPLGAELDLAAYFQYGAVTFRADYGVLLPLGGLGARGGSAPGIAQMLLLRLGVTGDQA